jgi:hypothetical protein
MHRKTLAKLLVVLAGLVILAAPVAQAAESLVLTCTVCTKLVINGKGLPANEEVRVGVVDVKTGQETTSQFNVTTDADGAFSRTIPMDLGKHPALESTVWRKSTGNVLVVAAHTRFTAPCKPEDTLAFTGSHTPLLLGSGLTLLLLGGLLLRGSRRAYTPAH